jgi:hypothetical protein
MNGIASTETIHRDKGDYWLEYKAELSAGDMRRLRRNFIRVDDKGNAHIKADDPEAYGWALIRLGMVDWSFTDIEGNKLPITDEGIGSLRDQTCTEIVSILGEQYKPLSQDRKNE